MNKEVSGQQPKIPVASRKVSNFINDIVNKDKPIAPPLKDLLMKTLEKKPTFQPKNLSDESDDDDESVIVVDKGTDPVADESEGSDSMADFTARDDSEDDISDLTAKDGLLDLSAKDESQDLRAKDESLDDDDDDDDEPMDLTALEASDVDEDEDLEYEDEIEEEKENRLDFEDKIAKTVEYLTLHDVAEVGKILDDLGENVAVEEEMEILEKLVLKWVKEEIAGDVPDIAPIEEVIKKIREYGVPNTQLLRLTMALKDIKKNFLRVSDILRRMQVILDNENRTVKDVTDGLKDLLRENLISMEMYNQLLGLSNNLDIDQIADVIKTAKIGRGFNFLPRETAELERKLEVCGTTYHEEPTLGLKQRILAILHELKCRRAIS